MSWIDEKGLYYVVYTLSNNSSTIDDWMGGEGGVSSKYDKEIGTLGICFCLMGTCSYSNWRIGDRDYFWS